VPVPDWWINDYDVDVIVAGIDAGLDPGEIEVDVTVDGIQGAQGPQGVIGPAGTQPVFTMALEIEPTVGRSRYYVEAPSTIASVRASVDSSPIGSDVVVDVNKNGSTIFTTQANRPRIAPGQNTDVSVPDVPSVSAGDYLTVDIDSVGSSYPGAWLTVSVTFA
jgi:hypothetical protein